MIMKELQNFTNANVLTKEESNIIEEKIFKYLQIGDTISETKTNIENIQKREKKYFLEKDYNRPQSIFFIKLDSGITIFGRKIISELYKKNLITSKNCSLISKNMIIGLLSDYKKQNRNIEIEYYPLTDGERKYLFNNIIKTNKKLDINYPFKIYDYETNKEISSPSDGWKIYDNTEQILFNGEKHLRKYTLEFLKEINIRKGDIFFDPACSTGDFLYTIKKEYPNIITIGQDLGKEMVECSRKKLDKVYCGNSINTPIEDDSVNFLFLRFLNSRVVTKDNAMQLYDKLIKKVKIGGYIICFGHTPVLLAIDELKKENFELISCTGYNEEYDSIFQYYIFRRYS